MYFNIVWRQLQSQWLMVFLGLNNVPDCYSGWQIADPVLNVGESVYTYWDSIASPEDMEDMWNHPEVQKEWIKSKEKRGQARFSKDEKNRPYLSRVEVKVWIY